MQSPLCLRCSRQSPLAYFLEFTDALTEVLAENAVCPARRGRLARARAAVKKQPDYSESGYLLAVETAFADLRDFRCQIAIPADDARGQFSA